MDGTGGAVSAKMNIVTRRLDEIHPCPTNAKTHDQKQVDNVANCIRFAGWTQPIVIAQNGEIVIGHCRYLAARQLGCKEVPCLLKDELDERQLRALRVLDNKLNESPWDADLLKVELDDLDFSEMGIDVDFDGGISDDGFGTDFSLADGDRAPLQNMTFTFSDDEAEAVKAAIQQMKKSKAFAEYENPNNENGNGKAIYLMVCEWRAQKT